MGKSTSMPSPPDPKETAAAQTSTNVATALANAALKNVNQVTPYGSLDYSQTGRQFIADPNGQTYYVSPAGDYSTSRPALPASSVAPSKPTSPLDSWLAGLNTSGAMVQPKSSTSSATTPAGGTGLPSGYTTATGYYIPTFTATQTLSPEEQAIFDQSEAAKGNLAGIANEQSAFLKNYLPQSVDLQTGYDTGSPDEVRDALLARLDPELARERSTLETKLTNQGLNPGSTAYDNAIDAAGRQENDARLAAILNATQQQAAEAGINQNAATFHNQAELAQRNQPLNEIAALLSGSQVQQPNFINTSEPTVPTFDYAGLVEQNYKDRVAAAQAQQAQQNQMLGGLFGLGSKLLTGGLLSDRRMKTDIRRVGKLDNGLPVYSFRYKFGGPMQIGVMAQDVEVVKPEAVREIGNIKFVDYGQAVEAL